MIFQRLVRYITNFGFITDAIQGNDNLTAVTPNNLHFLDRPTNEVGINGTDVVTGGNSLNITSLTNPGGGGPTGDPSTGGAGTIQAGADGITQDKGGRSLFHVKKWIYVYSYKWYSRLFC